MVMDVSFANEIQTDISPAILTKKGRGPWA